MPIKFEEDEFEDEYAQGLDIFKEHLKSLVPGPSMINSGDAAETVRGFHHIDLNSRRSPSPMQVDTLAIPDDMEVENPPIAESATTPSTSGTRPLVRATSMKRRSPTAVIPADIMTLPTSTPPSPNVVTAHPSKRLHMSATSSRQSAPADSSRSPISPFALPAQPAQPAYHPHTTTSSCRQSAPERGSELGTKLDPFIIAHDENVQRLMDAAQLAWGTVYELARGVTKGYWNWSAVTPDRIERLRGTNSEAAGKVVAVMQDRDAPVSHPEVTWIEYDREQAAIIENKGRGLGGMGEWESQADWYGGQIQQVARLCNTGKTFSIQLEKAEKRRSHRFSRFLGSRRILQLKISGQLLRDQLGEETRNLLISSRFILCGRVFLPFHAKEGSVYLLETSQNYQRLSRDEDGDALRTSLSDFIQWHNPPHLNIKQPISKWSTRWALGLSTSVPTVQFIPNNIHSFDDEYVSPWKREDGPPAEKVLTDGCGWINGSALSAIMRIMKYSSRPTAVQGRIGGSKGMWLLHPDPLEQGAGGPPKIWIRPSQTKIQLGKPSELGSAQLKFDLLAPSRVTSPSRLNSQLLLNLSHNGIDHQLLKDLLALGLEEEIKPFKPEDWSQLQSLVVAWKAVESSGSVVTGHVRKMVEGQARALGIGHLRPKDNQGIEDEDDDDMTMMGPNHAKSLTLHESVLQLLQSGFQPDRLELLFDKLGKIITLVLDDYLEKFHIPLTQSCEAYIVPDPYGVLEEGQIHFRSSNPFTNSTTGEQTDIIFGDVLVSRSPTRLPSDVQKVKAVAHPKLSNYYDVIVFPIKGKQSLASYLGGGDYDGDTVMIIWHPQLVEQFQGSPYCPAPPDLFTSFEREVEYIRDFDHRVSKLSPKGAQQAFQHVLLLGLAETKVGLYSTFHDAAVYERGYGSKEAIHLAYMFTTCLDSSKTGLKVIPHIFKQHQSTWGSKDKKPWYVWKLEQATGKKSKNADDKSCQKRQNPPLILDELVEEGEKLKKVILMDYTTQKNRFPFRTSDDDLLQPWQTAYTKAKQVKDSAGYSGFVDNLKAIQKHVEDAWGAYQRAIAQPSGSGNPFDRVASGFAQQPMFQGPQVYSDEEVKVLKASLAAHKNMKFAFSVALPDLCSIKAQAAQGGKAAMTHEFAQLMSIPNIVTRAFSQTQNKGV